MAQRLRGQIIACVHGDERKVVSLSTEPLVDPSGTRIGTVVSCLDVTAREEARRRVADMQARYAEELEQAIDARTAEILALSDELRAALAAKDELLANVSHELRTPLNVIIGLADVLARGLTGPLSDEQSRQIAMIKTAGRQLLALIEELLDMERLERGHVTNEPEPCDIRDILDELVAMMQPLAQERSVMLLLEPGEPLPATVDVGALTQIVRNLISNAVKFTPAGGSIRVAGRREEEAVVVEVTDTGVGIAPGDLERIFEPFAQVRRDGEGKPHGVGLGLAISKRLAASIGGDLSVASEPGVGTTFTLRVVAPLPGEDEG